jgi:hypothetical protein
MNKEWSCKCDEGDEVADGLMVVWVMELVRRESLGQESRFWGEAERKTGMRQTPGKTSEDERDAQPHLSTEPSEPFGWSKIGKRAE